MFGDCSYDCSDMCFGTNFLMGFNCIIKCNIRKEGNGSGSTRKDDKRKA